MEDSPSKPSVAELAGKFNNHILPNPTSKNELPFRRRPPCSLKLHHEKDDNQESDKPALSPNSCKIKMKSSAIIEKLQANLALSPTALLPSSACPEVKPHPSPLSPTMPCSPVSPLSPTMQPSHLSSEEEDAVSFDSPPEGAPLPSINKTRVRLSFKRRPPTRQHRRSAGDEAGASGSTLSPCELYSPQENGDKDQVFDYPAVEAKYSQLKEAEDKYRDCEKTEDEVAKNDPERRRAGEEEQASEHAQSSEALEEVQHLSEPYPAEQIGGDETEEGQEEMPQEAYPGGNDLV
uniref:capZ-interacting protein isoform X2 n=1 Tax=Monopterus albus TaxID=43700 RepID=UPI0009B45B8D|nr:capZ-interacting protein-like isoform X2 [Monopterus albus]